MQHGSAAHIHEAWQLVAQAGEREGVTQAGEAIFQAAAPECRRLPLAGVDFRHGRHRWQRVKHVARIVRELVDKGLELEDRLVVCEGHVHFTKEERTGGRQEPVAMREHSRGENTAGEAVTGQA
jgi:hypothetical protein